MKNTHRSRASRRRHYKRRIAFLHSPCDYLDLVSTCQGDSDSGESNISMSSWSACSEPPYRSMMEYFMSSGMSRLNEAVKPPFATSTASPIGILATSPTEGISQVQHFCIYDACQEQERLDAAELEYMGLQRSDSCYSCGDADHGNQSSKYIGGTSKPSRLNPDAQIFVPSELWVNNSFGSCSASACFPKAGIDEHRKLQSSDLAENFQCSTHLGNARCELQVHDGDPVAQQHQQRRRQQQQQSELASACVPQAVIDEHSELHRSDLAENLVRSTHLGNAGRELQAHDGDLVGQERQLQRRQQRQQQSNLASACISQAAFDEHMKLQSNDLAENLVRSTHLGSARRGSSHGRHLMGSSCDDAVGGSCSSRVAEFGSLYDDFDMGTVDLGSGCFVGDCLDFEEFEIMLRRHVQQIQMLVSSIRLDISTLPVASHMELQEVRTLVQGVHRRVRFYLTRVASLYWDPIDMHSLDEVLIVSHKSVFQHGPMSKSCVNLVIYTCQGLLVEFARHGIHEEGDFTSFLDQIKHAQRFWGQSQRPGDYPVGVDEEPYADLDSNDSDDDLVLAPGDHKVLREHLLRFGDLFFHGDGCQTRIADSSIDLQIIRLCRSNLVHLSSVLPQLCEDDRMLSSSGKEGMEMAVSGSLIYTHADLAYALLRCAMDIEAALVRIQPKSSVVDVSCSWQENLATLMQNNPDCTTEWLHSSLRMHFPDVSRKQVKNARARILKQDKSKESMDAGAAGSSAHWEVAD
mmetsp:Transcript_54378/g.138133  ORF Transcript_54378/g.138133 Transcript_54378/m.138133 type:complete len:747 (-) Transcript_54378:379-2619(-)